MMQNDLISRSALIEMCNELSAIEWNQKAAPVSWADAYEHFADELEKAPAVDAVEVTRCRDCKHGIPFYDCAVECRLEETDYAVIREDFDFCSYGERRAENE